MASGDTLTASELVLISDRHGCPSLYANENDYHSHIGFSHSTRPLGLHSCTLPHPITGWCIVFRAVKKRCQRIAACHRYCRTDANYWKLVINHRLSDSQGMPAIPHIRALWQIWVTLCVTVTIIVTMLHLYTYRIENDSHVRIPGNWEWLAIESSSHLVYYHRWTVYV